MPIGVLSSYLYYHINKNHYCTNLTSKFKNIFLQKISFGVEKFNFILSLSLILAINFIFSASEIDSHHRVSV